MKNKLNILYVASEVFPFTQTGALGEITGALPKYLKNYGHDIRVMMPNYRSINERKYVLREVIRLQGIKIKIGDGVYEATAKSAFIPDSKVQVYFLDNKDFFEREGLYGDLATGKVFSDNAERFTFFCKGCLEILKLLHWQPDIIHCNDWQTAIIPFLLKTVYANDAFLKNTRTLLSFYSLANEGVFESAVAAKLGMTESLSDYASLKKNDQINFLKVGFEFADLLSTASSASSKALTEQFRDSEYFDILKKRKDDIHGISNGIDEQVWNPELDNLIPEKFSRRDLSGKAKNKEELLKRFGLRLNDKTAVISLITRRPDDEVTDAFCEMVDQVARLETQVLIAGPAAVKHKKKLKAVQKEYPDRVASEPNLDSALLHLLVAGSDACLAPSRFESCGLSHLYGLAYGTIPIVHSLGSGAEFIQDVNNDNSSGNGLVFLQTDSKELLKVIKNVIKYFDKKDFWSRIVQNAMKQELSWGASAQKYIKLYQKLLGAKSSSK